MSCRNNPDLRRFYRMRALPEFGSDGHYVFSTAAGRKLWQPPADGFPAQLKP